MVRPAGVGGPAWYTALGDPVVGEAPRVMRDEPAHAWTVARPAARAGGSRSAFARRFTALVREPGLAYLTRWRMTLAADLLLEPDATIADVARRMGYADPFNFSTAYKRVTGRRPSSRRVRS